MQIGRKIYYELITGNVILDTGERSGDVVETTSEQDFASYAALAVRVPESVGMLQLEYGQYAEDFAACNGYRVDPDTEQVLFSYPGPDEPETPVFQRPLTETVAALENESALMALELVDTQTRLQQSEADHAALLLELVDKGVI
ncbi:hypothetical protein ACX93W_05180 [Paenibacillus sp. CAU 1782]